MTSPNSATPPRDGWLRSPASHHFAGMNMWELLRMRAATSGELPFMIWHPFNGEGKVWTYGAFLRDASAVAAGLTSRGVKQGDRVLVHLENCPEFLLSWFACAAIGAVIVTTNTRSASDELSYYASHSEAVAAITQPKFAELVAVCAPAARWVACLDHDSGVAVDEPRGPGADGFAALHGDPDDVLAAPPDPTAPMSVQYTSGTTARPKGVLWTHANALWGAKLHAAVEDLHATDRHFVYAPLFHANAVLYSVLPTLWAGGSFVLVPKWSTSRFWSIACQHEATWMALVSVSYRALTNGSMEPPERHSFRMFGAGACEPPALDRAYGTKTIGWFGMTETVGAPIVGDALLPNRPMVIGRPSPAYGVAVVRDDGTAVEPGETGEVRIKGTPGLSIFAEYLHDPAATANSFDEWGWFRTGDLVTPHRDGTISYTDRAKDMLRVGSENVAASEIERVILGVPGVVEAAVVGRPDERLDEVPVAFVRTDGADPVLADRVESACASALADFKVPRAVYVVADLPRSTISKINKVELRAVVRPEDDREAAEKRWLAEALLDPSGDAS